jgi:hypothetical protein
MGLVALLLHRCMGHPWLASVSPMRFVKFRRVHVDGSCAAVWTVLGHQGTWVIHGCVARSLMACRWSVRAARSMLVARYLVTCCAEAVAVCPVRRNQASPMVAVVALIGGGCSIT